jgi:hypothetical protein
MIQILLGAKVIDRFEKWSYTECYSCPPLSLAGLEEMDFH